MRPAQLALLAAIAVAPVSCGGSASPTSPQTVTTPTVDRVGLATGAYDFFAFQSNPPAECGVASPSGLSLAALSSHVILSHEGADWIARAASPADGDVEVRFHDSGGNILSGPPGSQSFLNIVATIRGTAVQPPRTGADGVTFAVDAVAATVPNAGFVVLSGATTIFVEGLTPIGGSATFTTGSASRTCRLAASWALTKPLAPQ